MTLFAPQKQAENEVMYQKRRRAAIYICKRTDQKAQIPN